LKTGILRKKEKRRQKRFEPAASRWSISNGLLLIKKKLFRPNKKMLIEMGVQKKPPQNVAV
jgi:hypothetical protein